MIELPMEARPNDPLGRQTGERLWPEHFTAEMVEIAKRDPRAWNALYQQSPIIEEGDYFKLDWFTPFVSLPENVTCYGASDYAVTEGGGDYTEHGIFAVDPLGNIYIIDWWRGQTTTDVWIERQLDLIRRHEPACWFGEKGAIEKAVRPYLTRRMNERRAYCRIEWLPCVHEKTVRARSFQALASMNKIFIPAAAAWKSELIGQLTRFPAGKYDDAVDVCSLIGRGLKMLPPAMTSSPGKGRRAGRFHVFDYEPFPLDERAADDDRDDRMSTRHHAALLRQRATGGFFTN